MVIVSVIVGKSTKYLLTILKTMFALILLIFLLQSLMYQGNSEILWHMKFISVKKAGLLYAVNLSTMLLDISGTFILLFLLTDIKKIMLVLEEHGLSPKAAYVVISTLQIIPEMRKKLMVIMDAQRSRGVETEGNLFIRATAFFPILIPLVISSIISIEERALMLEARAFSLSVKKTHLAVTSDTKYDKALRNILIIVVTLVIIGRIVTWIL
jgi:cobalt/nickel transport system permease protein/energy-coupling factor transport system permease protein